MFHTEDTHIIALSIAIMYAQLERELKGQNNCKSVLSKVERCATNLVGREAWNTALKETPK